MKTLRRILSYRQNVLALLLLALFVLAAIFAPQLAPPDDPDHPSPFRVVGKFYDMVPHPPSEEAPLGTTPGQRDVYHTLIWGTRSALRFGLITALSAACIGTAVGAFSGFFGGVVSGLIMRVADGFLAFPVLAGVWLLRQVLVPSPLGDPTPVQQSFHDLGLDPVMLALILFSWMPYARLVHASIVQLKQTEYVLAAQSLGMRNGRIIRRHLLPNALPPALVLVARDVGAMVVLESAFTYIGFGGNTEWGILLVSSRDYVIGSGGNPLAYWWVFLPITLVLVVFGISWNLLGDGLNTVLNPRSR